jgi:hypothetical protein
MLAEAFEALASAFEKADAPHRVRIATAFYSRLGDVEPHESALDAIALAEATGANPAGDMLEVAKAHHSETELADAAIYAARS